MNKQKAKELILEDLERCRDSFINMFEDDPRKEYYKYYQTWIDQITNNCITDERLWKWIDNYMNYYQEKDKQYCIFVEQILNEGLENATKL